MLGAVASGLLCIGCTQELKDINPAYNPDIIDGDVKYVEFIIPGFVDEGQNVQTKTTLTSKGFVWAEKDTVGIFPSKGNQIYYEMSSGAGSSSAVFDGGGWALKDEYIYSSYYPLKGDFYLDRKSIPVTYSTEVTQCGNDNPDHLGANAYMFAPETTVSNGKVKFKYWQLGSVLMPRVTLPAGTYTKLVLSTEVPIFVVSGKYDLTTGVDASSSSATMPDFVPVIVPDEDKSGSQSLTNSLTINLEDVEFAAETELVAYIMAAPVDVSNIPITVTIYSGDSPKYRYEYVRTSCFVAQTNYHIRPDGKGLMTTANTTESANTAFAAGETSLSLVDVEDKSVFDLVLPATEEPVNIFMEANEGKCTMNVSYPDGATSPEELNIIASNGSDITLNTPTSTVTLDGDREYTSVRASTAPNTLIINEDITIGTLYLEKGNVKVYGEIMALNTDDLEEGEHPTLFVYGDIQGQIDEDDVIVRRPIVSVSLDQSALELKPSDVVQLSVITEPQNAIFENVTWSSSDEKVATVTEDGTITSVSAGECLITIDIDGKQASCTVTVSSPGPEYVDLGLSVKWATCNLGASSPEEDGGYYQWAGTTDVSASDLPDWSYPDWSNCPYHTKDNMLIGWTKYIPLNKISYWFDNSNPDNQTILDQNDDVAHVELGGKWRMPTREEWEELMNTSNCSWEYTIVNGLWGYKVTSKKSGYAGNYIFLPPAGYFEEYGFTEGGIGQYWSSSLNTEMPMSAYCLFFEVARTLGVSNGGYRCEGRSIRPVYGDREVVTGVSLNKTSLDLTVGDSYTLSATVTPSNASEKSVNWSSSNTNVATIDQGGVVTAVKAGTTTITVRTTDGDHIATCNVTVSGPEAVDLGLSVKWASFNLGASSPEEYGGYYQWAGTKDVTNLSIYLDLSNCPYYTIGWTKYIPSNKPSYWCGSGSPDNLTILDQNDDVAHAELGGRWRMPTREEWEELINTSNCSWDYSTVNGVVGYKVTSKKSGYTGNSIFLPAAGHRSEKCLFFDNFACYYWSSSLDKEDPNNAYSIYNNQITTQHCRYVGHSVRPVLY